MKKYSKKSPIQKKPLKGNQKPQEKQIKKTYTKNKKNVEKRSSFGFLKFLIYTILFFLIACFILMLFLYNSLLKDLPSVSELENLNIAETSKIYDRNGKELYSVYKENRTYVPFNDISKNMVNAIVAGEDKKFWTNPGVDIVGIFRAGVYFLSGKTDSPKGTSTLTQQLIRNTIIEKRSDEGAWGGVERKIKEIYLSYQLTKHGSSKEKILELYLNKIAYGHNAHGIEAAGKTFFNTNAKDLNVLQSSILASLPKGPTEYSPYNHPERVVGNPILIEKSETGEEITTDLLTVKDITINGEAVQELKTFIQNLKGKYVANNDAFPLCGIDKNLIDRKISKSTTITIAEDGCTFLSYSDLHNFLGAIKIQKGEKTISYNAGRKDYILQRMLEDGYITFEEYKEAVLGGIGIKFYTKKEDINAPHFVFYVREYLEKKYGTETLSMGGLQIYTTLDFEVQKKAEEIVADQVAKNAANYNAKNGSLISIDNKTGGIIAMVGSADYYNEDIKGKVNVTTSRLQPGSTFKPFVYSLAMAKKKLGTRTPVWDELTMFPGYPKPLSNFDGKYMGQMTIASALNHSRNVPAVKMYFEAGDAKDIINFMKNLGVTTIDENRIYGPSLALGTAEMTALDLASAYSVFADMGEQVEINPIVKIIDSKGNIIEDNSEIKRKRVMPEGQAFLINYILSETDTRPSNWNQYLDLPDRLIASKTGTTTKVINDVQYPVNLWTIGYTPQITTVVWTGNSDGETLYQTANGLMSSGPIMKAFMQYFHQGKKAENWPIPSDIKSVEISRVNGYLAGENSQFTTSSYFLNTPTKVDLSSTSLEYDALCNGPVTNETPKEAIKRASVLEFHSLRPENPIWEDPVQRWAQGPQAKALYGESDGFIGALSEEACIRNREREDIFVNAGIDVTKPYKVGNNTLNISYTGKAPISTIELYLNGDLIKSVNAGEQLQGGFTEDIFIPARYKNSTVDIKIKAIDELYYSAIQNYKIFVVDTNMNIKDDVHIDIKQTFEEEGEEINKQEDSSKEGETQNSQNSDLGITITKPSSGSIKIYSTDYFNLRASISGSGTTEIFIDGVLHKNLGSATDIIEPINQINKLSSGSHTILLRTIDSAGNKIEKTINLEIL